MASSSNPGGDQEGPFNVIIIGAGPCGLATAARLREKYPSALFTDEEQSRYAWISRNAGRTTIKNKKTGLTKASAHASDQGQVRSMLVLDSSSDQWMAKWNALFKKLEISHLRSPMFFHTDPSDRDALHAFAYEQGRMNELDEIPGCVGKGISKHKRKKRSMCQTSSPKAVVEVDERDRKDYFNPSSACFSDFCEKCIQRYGLQEHTIRQERVEDIDFDPYRKLFKVSTTHGQHSARAVVMAVRGGVPVIPPPFPSELPETASHAMWLEDSTVLSSQLQAKIRAQKYTTALVIGAGLTSAQVADCLVRKGVRQVHLVMRGPWKVKPFDVDLSWMSKFRNQQRAAFWTADSLEERLRLAKNARNGGSMTPRFAKKLKAHVQAGRLHVHTNTTIASQQYSKDAGVWDIQTEPQVPELPPFDRVYFATGSSIDVEEIGFLQTINQQYPIRTCGGFPALTDDLAWHEDVPLFVAAKLATLQIGPGAANLEGARLGAERIVWAIDELLGGSEGVAEEGEEIAGHDYRHRYAAGIGSRFDRLSEA